MDAQWRARFDARVTFRNGGGLTATGFKLDIPGPDISDSELAELFVGHLGLLMVETVSITGTEVLREAHRGSRGVAISAPAGRRLVELSHVIRAGMTTYPGLPGPGITSTTRTEGYASGTSFTFTTVTMIGNTGTYLDAPAHRHPDGMDHAGLPLERVADLDGIVVRVPEGSTAIDALLLAPHPVTGRAVLVHTGWDRHFGSEHYGAGGHPYLTEEAVALLVRREAALVGIDSLNIDDARDGRRPAHTALLGAGVPIVEHLTGLGALPPSGFRFHAAAPRIAGMVSLPVRAYAVVGPVEPDRFAG